MSITDHIKKYYGIMPDAVIELDEPVNDPNISEHHHVVIRWAGGEMWLDMATFNDHHCVDIRQMNDSGKLKGQGAFTIVNGRRGAISPSIEDSEGTTVTGHNWPGGYVMTLLTDLHGAEDAAREPDWGVG